jgi:hypothetical protein
MPNVEHPLAFQAGEMLVELLSQFLIGVRIRHKNSDPKVSVSLKNHSHLMTGLLIAMQSQVSTLRRPLRPAAPPPDPD